MPDTGPYQIDATPRRDAEALCDVTTEPMSVPVPYAAQQPREAKTRQVRHMAVLFADLTGSTRLYSTLGDDAARGVVDACIAEMLAVLPQYEGRLIKTIGDEIMCVFPSADQSMLAASDMQARVTDNPPAGYPVSIHIGLHFGPVLVEDEDVFGDTVNAAAYLTAVASGEQILITEATQSCLSPELKGCVRPVFNAVLKGNTEESTVYQILWRKDNVDITDVNLQQHRIIPADTGSLLLSLGKHRLRIDQHRTSVQLGRGPDCDLVVTDKFASRAHAVVNVQRTHFYLIDESINGTYVLLDGGEEIHLLRGELLLERSGKISLGRSFKNDPVEVIEFARDRRALYRV